jgi:poly-gamma-glutamate synthesis protein (capsule biosynthesis protein)
MKRITLQFITVIILTTSACSISSNPPAQMPVITPAATTSSATTTINISGRVVDLDGAPISGASISTDTGNALSDERGWFHITSNQQAQWVTATKSGFISRTRAAEPGVPILIRISPDDGKTIVINFGGDTMFGRRFFDPNEDGDPSDGLLPVNPDIQDHLKLLKPIRPLLETGDLTVVNFESALSDEPFFSPRDPRPTAYHPYKEFVYASSPNAIFALKQAGVDIVDTGNNHVYDMLDDGLAYTQKMLDQADMAYFGSGANEESAWAPKIIEVKGQTIAFIGCTSIWTPVPPVTQNDISYVASDQQNKGGAARCTNEKLYAAVTDAKIKANFVIVMIHGGFEYSPMPSPNVVNFTKIAKTAGASLIINGHSHVPGGFIWENQSLIAQTMGNFIFDQTIWPTFKSYMLTIYMREGKVIRAFAEPLMVENYIAHGITGELADYVTREAAGWEQGPFVIENGAMEIDINQLTIKSSKTATMDGGTGTIIQIPQGQWLSNFQGNGSVLLGRDLLWVGSFENSVIDNESGTPPLWEQDETSNTKIGADYAYMGEAGIRLSRGSGNQTDAVTTNLHRILVSPGSKLTISGFIRKDQGAVALLQISLYPDTFGPSSDQILKPLITQEVGIWEPFRFDVVIPEGIVALGVFLKLSPPNAGTSTADFDNIRVIEWAPAETPFGILYNFVHLTGSGDLTFSQSILPGGEDWLTSQNLDFPTLMHR